MILPARDPFGFERHFYRTDGRQARSIAALAPASSTPDIEAIRGYLNHQRLPGRSVLHEVLAVPPDPLPRPEPAAAHDLATRLQASLRQALKSPAPALALSGGLDSALLLALLKAMGVHDLPVYILATGLPGYCEREAALDMARRLGVPAKVVHAGESDFVAALPDTARQVEEPIFNLHPVAKLLLARAMAADGITLAITGDGADQVLRRDQSANYLPLCHALFDATGVQLHAPFLDSTVVAALCSLPPDPQKQCLRELAASLDLPARLVRGPKQSRLAPAMSLGPLAARDAMHDLARRLGLPAPALDTDAERVQWASLSITLNHLGAA